MVYCARHFVFVQTPWHFSANLQTSSVKKGALFVSAKNSQVSKRKVARKNAMEAVLRALRGSAGPFPLHYRPAVTASPPLQSRLGFVCNNLNTGGWKLQAVTLNCYATFARTCYECGFRVCISFRLCFGQILNQVQNDGWQGAFL